jgi:hypothetical protein
MKTFPKERVIIENHREIKEARKQGNKETRKQRSKEIEAETLNELN